MDSSILTDLTGSVQQTPRSDLIEWTNAGEFPASLLAAPTLTVTPATASIAVAASVQLSAVKTQGGMKQETQLRGGWSSDTVATATVDDDGLVVGVAAGVVPVRYERDLSMNSASITVTA